MISATMSGVDARVQRSPTPHHVPAIGGRTAMAAPKYNLVGRRFGRLVVVAFAGNLPMGRRGRRWASWKCLCDCGTSKTIRQASLLKGETRSCGCYFREQSSLRGRANVKHGLRSTKEYHAWQGMKQRCYDQHCRGFARYGGRGIRVDGRWRASFTNFLRDVGRAPTAAHSLDRINTNGHYEPGNVRWATKSEQARNRRPCTCPHCEYHQRLHAVEGLA